MSVNVALECAFDKGIQESYLGVVARNMHGRFAAPVKVGVLAGQTSALGRLSWDRKKESFVSFHG